MMGIYQQLQTKQGITSLGLCACPEALFLCFSFSCPLDLQLAKDGLFAPSAAICCSTLGE